MKKRILVLIMAAIIAATTLIGCGNSNESINTTQTQETKMIGSLICVEKWQDEGFNNHYICVDVEEKTMYWYIDAHDGGAEVIQLTNLDGTPKLYEGELQQ